MSVTHELHPNLLKIEIRPIHSKPTLYRTLTGDWRVKVKTEQKTINTWNSDSNCLCVDVRLVDNETKCRETNSRWNVWPWIARKRWNLSHSRNTDNHQRQRVYDNAIVSCSVLHSFTVHQLLNNNVGSLFGSGWCSKCISVDGVPYTDWMTVNF